MLPALLRAVLVIALAAPAASALGQITVPPTVPRDSKIVCVVDLAGVPPGAELKGQVVPIVPGAQVEPGPSSNVFHLWAPPGTYCIEVLGMWGLRHPDHPQAWIDFGLFRYEATFTVQGGGPGPGPDPPDPPTPGGKYLLMLTYEADRLDNYPEPQRRILTSRVLWDQLTSKGHKLLRVVERSALDLPATPEWKPWFDLAKGQPTPGLILAPIGGGPGKYLPLPASLEDFIKVLDGKP